MPPSYAENWQPRVATRRQGVGAAGWGRTAIGASNSETWRNVVADSDRRRRSTVVSADVVGTSRTIGHSPIELCVKVGTLWTYFSPNQEWLVDRETGLKCFTDRDLEAL